MKNSLNPDLFIDTFLYQNKKIHLLDYHIQRIAKALTFKRSNSLNVTSDDISISDLSFFKQCYQDMLQKLQHNTDDSNQYIVHVDWNLKLRVYDFSARILQPIKEPLSLIKAELAYPFKGLGLQTYKHQNRIYWNEVIKNIDLRTTDVAALSDDGFCVEASRFNLFFVKEKKAFTPTLHTGCVDGCFRRWSLDQGFLIINEDKLPLTEKDIRWDNLNEYSIYIGNSVRGLLAARLANTF